MASFSVKVAKHAALAPSAIDTITFDGGAPTVIEVENRSSSEIYLTINGADPTVAGDDTYVVPAGRAKIFGGGQTVKLISTLGAAYSVARVA